MQHNGVGYLIAGLIIPAPAWSAIASAMVTSIIGYLGISVMNREHRKRLELQHEHERKQRDGDILRERGEELCVSIKKFCNFIFLDHLPYVKVMKGEMDYNKALDRTINSGKDSGYDAQRMMMIADIYFPELSVEIDKLVDFNSRTSNLRNRFKENYKRGVFKDLKLADTYTNEIEKLSSAADSLEKKVIQSVKKKIAN